MLSRLFKRKASTQASPVVKESKPGKRCVLVPQRFSPEQEIDRINSLMGTAKPEEEYIFLSNMGGSFDLEGTHLKPANMFTPLDESISSVFVSRTFPVLYANEFTTAWLGNILMSLGTEGRLWLEIPNQRSNRARNLLTIEYLSGRLPSLSIAQRGPWFEIEAQGGLAGDIQKLKTIYRCFMQPSGEFLRLWAKTFTPPPPDHEPMQGNALTTYIYSLFGASQKSLVFQKIIDDYLDGRAIEGLDLGAGYGFMACELAMQGHSMTAADYDGTKLDTVGRWLVEQAGLESRVRLKVDSIENLPSYDKTYDAISLFGSLLAIKKEMVPEVLSSAMRLLNAGGVLLVHENPKEIGTPGTSQYEDRFKAEELLSLLRLHAGEPSFYSLFSAKSIPWRQAKRGIIMAVVAKQG